MTLTEALTEKYVSFILKRAKHIILFTMAITILSIALLPNLRIENTRGKFTLPEDDPVMSKFTDYEKLFGSHESILVLIETDSVMDSAFLTEIHHLTGQLENLEGVSGVYSLTNAKKAIWIPGIASYRPRFVTIFRPNGESRFSMQSLRKFVLEEPVYKGNFISDDGHHLGIIIDADGVAYGEEQSVTDKIALITGIRETLRPFSEKYAVVIAGLPLVDEALQISLKRSVSIFGPLSIAFIIIVTVFLFRAWKPALVVLLVALFSLIWTLAILSIAGISLSLGLAMLVPLTVVVSTAYSMHYVDFGLENLMRYGSMENAIRGMVSKVLRPSVLCGVTTAIGFLALDVSELKEIREIGLYLAIGVMCCIYMANLFLPALITLCFGTKSDRSSIHEKVTGMAVNIGQRAIAHHRIIIGGVIIIAVVAAAGLSKLKLETNHLNYFKPDSSIRRNYTEVDRVMGGTLPLDVILSCPVSDMDNIIPRLINLEENIKNIDGVGRVFSVMDILRMMEKAKPARVSPALFSFDLKKFHFSENFWQRLHGEETLGEYFKIENDTAYIRLASRVRAQGSEGLGRIVDDYKAATVQVLPGRTADITGLVPLFVQTQKYIILTQIYSFGLSLLVIFVLFFVISRSLALGIIAAFANVISIAFVIGLMGFWSVPLDVATVMIASVAIAISADDTIHFIYSYRNEMNDNTNTGMAVGNTLQLIGSPVIMSSILICGGFLILGLSSFSPTRYFGLLSGLIVAMALVADLVVMPALIRAYEKVTGRSP